MADTVGELQIGLSFDSGKLKGSLNTVEKNIENTGKSSGSKFGSAWTVAAGNLISKGISSITGAITSNVDRAIKRVDTLANAKNVFEAMGYSAEDVADSMKQLNEYLDGLPTSMTDAVQNVQALSASFGGIKAGTTYFKAMNDAALAFTTDGANAANGAIMQLSQIPLDGPLDAQTWNSLRNNGFTPVFAAMAKEAGITVSELKEQFGAKGTKTVKDFLDALVKMDTDGTKEMDSLSSIAEKNTSGIGTAIENLQNRIGKAIAEIINHIGQENISNFINDFSSGLKGVADVVIGIMDFLGQNQWILDAIMAFVVGLLGMGLAVKVQAFFALLSGFFATNPVVLAIGVITGLLFLLMTHLDEVGKFFETVFGGIGEFVGGVFENIGGFFEGFFTKAGEVIQGVGDFFGGMWQGVMDSVGKVWEFITGIFGKVGEFFGKVFGGAWEAVKKIFSTGGKIFAGIVEGIANAFKTIVNAIIRGINFVVAIPFNAINGFLNILRGINILGFQPFSWIGQIGVPQIPLLAQGGYASGATGAIIGEEGKEAVLPLERNTDNWSGLLAGALADEFESMDRGLGSGITIQNQNFNIDSRLDAENIGQIMMQSIRRQAR